MYNQTTTRLGPAALMMLMIFTAFSQTSCNTQTQASEPANPVTALTKSENIRVEDPVVSGKEATAQTILGRTEVPILCYHQIRDWQASDSKGARDYIVPVNMFRAQMQSLADSGYHTILPEQLHEYLAYGKALPEKPVMITFDDTRLDQYTAALPELEKHDFKGAFFIMTVSLGRPGYMTKEEVKQLSDKGHTIGSHTWDHNNVKKYEEKDWAIQIEKPSAQLSSIIGKPIEYFAYPFGLWNKEAIAHLKTRGFKTVFQLATKMDDADPLFTIRRIIVPGTWSGPGLQGVMRKSFH